jgi:thiol:disulfide interchange protein DsbD
MEERIWAEPKILRILKNDIVLISLYVDEKKELPSEEHYTSATTGKRVRTYGNKWSDFQIERYQANAQPYYILMNLDESNLNAPVGYTPDVDEYEAWLKEGISNFSEKK